MPKQLKAWTVSKEESFLKKKAFSGKAEAGRYAVGNRETNSMNFMIFF